MDNSKVPACLQIGGAGAHAHTSSTAPSSGLQSRSATPPILAIQHTTPATTVIDDDSSHSHHKNPYISANLERSINSWLDNMVEVKCLPFNAHAQAPYGWEGLEPYSEDEDEELKSVRAGDGMDVDMDRETDLDVLGGKGDLESRDVKRGYEEWMESVGKQAGFGLVGGGKRV